MIKKIYHKIRQWTIPLEEKMHDIYDRKFDMKICGCSLVKRVPSKYRETMGATASHPARYKLLDEVFQNIEFNETDSLLDVGCAKGRIIAYLLYKGFKGKITGIELNDDEAKIAKEWTKRYDNVNVISGNALEIDSTKYNVFFLFRPFETPTFLKFLQKLDKEIDKPVKLVYVSDQINRHFLTDRPGWKMVEKGRFFRYRIIPWLPIEFAVVFGPQCYSVWEFDPVEKAAYDGPIFEEFCECTDYSSLSNYDKLDVEYCKKYNIYFDGTMYGRNIPIVFNRDKDFDFKKCYKNSK